MFEEWISDGIIEMLPNNEINFAPTHYTPHRYVVKLESTTKIRPVFDTSAKETGYPFLTDCLGKGLNLIELIPTSLLRFRKGEIGVIADIWKAFS